MIIFNGVTKQFGDNTYALQDVSFTVEPGEFVFLTGPSGSGKTTLMRLLTREYTPTEGEIIVDDMPLHEIRSQDVYQHRRQIGVIFQDYKLLSESNVWENIALPLYIMGKSEAEIESRVTDLLKLVNLTEKAYLFPSQLSGGEAQRVSIARALATGPKVIFADEPTGNLDPETSITIAKLLHKINDLGTTVLLATHDTGVMAALGKERRIRLEKGRLIDDTKPKSSKVTKVSPKKTSESESEPAKLESKKDKDSAKEAKPETKKTEESTKPAKGKSKWKLGWPGKKKATKTADSDEDEDSEPDTTVATKSEPEPPPAPKLEPSSEVTPTPEPAHHVSVQVESLDEPEKTV